MNSVYRLMIDNLMAIYDVLKQKIIKKKKELSNDFVSTSIQTAFIFHLNQYNMIFIKWIIYNDQFFICSYALSTAPTDAKIEQELHVICCLQAVTFPCLFQSNSSGIKSTVLISGQIVKVSF
ncbi:hypothetical protein DERP_011789 [Dermatophagoides pteronyssinus]|uniref:Uncharacterized protein n=1 Tax=Dermatophagoides pteronyssinus TaxID=6956 RepID=A0ABQ8JR28_DERPT|nr:hypothetical protein DERP_011789 [Dermatophagoides pteronyssinus]